MRLKSVLIFSFLLVSCSTPKALFDIQKETLIAPASVKFKNQSEKAVSYIWDFGDGNTSADPNPEHRFSLSGKYIVKLKAIKGSKINIAQKQVKIEPPHDCLVELQTSLGIMVIKLFDSTPIHRDNFIKLAENKFYEGTLFHRVIKGFMIQGGDPNSKNAANGTGLGSGGPGYTIPAEFSDTLFHVKGALAAARQGDAVNPDKASSGSQFYIVQGRPVLSSQLENLELQKGIKYSAKAKDIMTNTGGTPSLDKEYTVFGQVVKGMDIIDKISENETDGSDRPLTDIKIIKIKIIH
ncbi:MAG: peptidylprolyl isomerase [Saprospiraceae bacterium]|nr:peptidylprolyl isomerase [Saprospiraceae bacterium]